MSLGDGIRLSDEKKNEEALKKFDLAIESGLYEEAYRERGYCLQALGFHLDAIDDFTKAIELFPTNSNNYYGRSLSYSALGVYDSAIADCEKAIELWNVKSPENLELERAYKEKNLSSPSFMYPFQLEQYQMRKNMDEMVKKVLVKSAIRRNSFQQDVQ